MKDASPVPLVKATKKVIQSALRPFGVQIRKIDQDPKITYPERTDRQLELIERFREYTMTGRHRQWCLLRAAQYIEQNAIDGDIVECGVWRGGNMMMLKSYFGPACARRFFLYDTYLGMSEPTGADVHFHGPVALDEYNAKKQDGRSDWAYASLDQVKRNFASFGLLDPDVVFVQGMVETTLRQDEVPQQIALLRLDTDWYQSTKVELEVLYPRLVKGGVLIVDDYGDWLGSKKAVDEYFGPRPPLMMPIDHGCRLAIKP